MNTDTPVTTHVTDKQHPIKTRRLCYNKYEDLVLPTVCPDVTLWHTQEPATFGAAVQGQKETRLVEVLLHAETV